MFAGPKSVSCPRKKPASTLADTGKVAGGKPATGRLCQAGLQNTRRVSGASPKRANPLDKKRFQAIKAKFIDAPCAPASYAGPATCAVLLCAPAVPPQDRTTRPHKWQG